jgi:predicted small lipoprotein YifL
MEPIMKSTFKLKTSIILLALASLTAACGDKAPAPPSDAAFANLESQRGIANDNSTYNALKWRAENGHEDLNILSRGDSTQQIPCTQGDGWASVDLIDKQTKQAQVKLKCSTVSSGVGCVPEGDFKARAVLASQENSCNMGIPSILKRIEK